MKFKEIHKKIHIIVAFSSFLFVINILFNNLKVYSAILLLLLFGDKLNKLQFIRI